MNYAAPPGEANYLSPKLTVWPCPEKNGRAVYAREALTKGELVAVFGGRIVGEAAARALPPELRRFVLQVEEGRFLAPLDTIDPAEYINHCCHPNTGLSGQIALVALRDIAAGEEITFDYATSDSSDFLGFACICDKSPCRGRVAAEDWRRPDVRARNRGHFSPYLQRRINAETG
jgi:hypothetical protein